MRAYPRGELHHLHPYSWPGDSLAAWHRHTFECIDSDRCRHTSRGQAALPRTLDRDQQNHQARSGEHREPEWQHVNCHCW